MIIVLFGVSGSGKTTVGRQLAAEVGWEFIDADDFHPQANIAKMRSGRPLNDRDRSGWLASLSSEIRHRIATGTDAVLACSALKRAYREQLSAGLDVTFVYLKADPAVIARRLAGRTGHFMPPELLASQFTALEEPGHGLLTLDASLPVNTLVADIRRHIMTGNL